MGAFQRSKNRSFIRNVSVKVETEISSAAMGPEDVFAKLFTLVFTQTFTKLLAQG